jgi:hypothetical protein
MIDAQDNVLDPDGRVGRRHLYGCRRCFDNERGCSRSHPGHLNGSIQAFNSNQHVGQGTGEPIDGDRLSVQVGPTAQDRVFRIGAATL